jgi:hypothetical protein
VAGGWCFLPSAQFNIPAEIDTAASRTGGIDDYCIYQFRAIGRKAARGLSVACVRKDTALSVDKGSRD